eukprot:362560-Chlamydomonas_euryale.AAC.4
MLLVSSLDTAHPNRGRLLGAVDVRAQDVFKPAPYNSSLYIDDVPYVWLETEIQATLQSWLPHTAAADLFAHVLRHSRS